MKKVRVLLVSVHEREDDLAKLVGPWMEEEGVELEVLRDLDGVVEFAGRARRQARPVEIFLFDDRGMDWARLFQITIHVLIQEPRARAILCVGHTGNRFHELLSEIPFRHRLLAFGHPVREMELRLGLLSAAGRACVPEGLEEPSGSCRGAGRFDEETTQIYRRELASQAAETDHLVTIGRLAAGLAHEINTPIQFINDSAFFIEEATEQLLKLMRDRQEHLERELPEVRGGAELLGALRAMDEEGDRAFLTEHLPGAFQRINQGLSQVNSIVQTMREFAPGGSEHNRVSVDLNEAVRNTLMIAGHQIRAIGEVKTELLEVPRVQANPSELKRLVLNLTINAAHAIEDRFGDKQGEGRIELLTGAREREVFVTVRDNGCGIPRGLQEKIFQPFFTTKGHGRGTGQGLAIVQAIVDRHGGRISVESEVQEGTTITVWFPRCHQAREREAGEAMIG